MTNFDNKKTLREQMRELLFTGDYFVKRTINKQKSSYWGDEAVIKDPDGNVRDLLKIEEIDKRVQNYKYIIEFIKKLSPDSVLDLGCGLGDMLINLDGIKVRTGVDSDIKLAQKRSNKICWIESNVESFENVSFFISPLKKHKPLSFPSSLLSNKICIPIQIPNKGILFSNTAFLRD